MPGLGNLGLAGGLGTEVAMATVSPPGSRKFDTHQQSAKYAFAFSSQVTTIARYGEATG